MPTRKRALHLRAKAAADSFRRDQAEYEARGIYTALADDYRVLWARGYQAALRDVRKVRASVKTPKVRDEAVRRFLLPRR